MLIALGLIYALLYAAWVRKRRRHGSAAVAVAGDDAAPSAAGAVHDRAVRAEGTYVSTTTAASRHERVAVAGLGNRARATMTVRRGEPEELVRSSGRASPTSSSREAPPRGAPGPGHGGQVRRSQPAAGPALAGRRRRLYETGFLPRYRADLERLEAALWWHQGGATIDSAPETREGDLST